MCSGFAQLRKPGRSPSAPHSRVFWAVGWPFIWNTAAPGRPSMPRTKCLALLFGDPVGGRCYERSASGALDIRAGDEPLSVVLDGEVHLHKRELVLHKVSALTVYTPSSAGPAKAGSAPDVPSKRRGTLTTEAKE